MVRPQPPSFVLERGVDDAREPARASGAGFSRAGLAVTQDPGWNDYDLEVRPDPWTRLRFKTADEEHEGARLKNHVAVRVRLSRLSLVGLAIDAGATVSCGAMGLSVMTAALAALTMASAMCAVSQAVESGRFAYQAIEQCAHELNLIPLGKPTAAARRAAAAAEPSTGAAAEPMRPRPSCLPRTAPQWSKQGKNSHPASGPRRFPGGPTCGGCGECG